MLSTRSGIGRLGSGEKCGEPTIMGSEQGQWRECLSIEFQIETLCLFYY